MAIQTNGISDVQFGQSDFDEATRNLRCCIEHGQWDLREYRGCPGCSGCSTNEISETTKKINKRTTWEDRANQLLKDHWEYHKILLAVVDSEFEYKEIETLYKAIGFHFYKHAVEDIGALKDDLV